VDECKPLILGLTSREGAAAADARPVALVLMGSSDGGLFPARAKVRWRTLKRCNPC